MGYRIRNWIVAISIYIIYFRQVNSIILYSDGFNPFFNLLLYYLIIMILLIFYGKIGYIWLKKNNCEILYYYIILYIILLIISNSLNDIYIGELINLNSAYILVSEWITYLAIFYITAGVLSRYDFQRLNQILTKLAYIVLLSATYTHFLTFGENPSESAILVYTGANRMIYGKLYFIGFLALSYLAINASLLKRALIFIGILIFLKFSIDDNVRTPIYAYFLFLFIAYGILNKRKQISDWSKLVLYGIFCFLVYIFVCIFIMSILHFLESDVSEYIESNILIARLDELLSGRLLSGLFGIWYFLSSKFINEYAYFQWLIGKGNTISNIDFKEYYTLRMEEILPNIDLNWFIESGYAYSPHNAFVDILISNGIFGLILIILFLKSSINNLNYNNKILALMITIVIGFFLTDLDFVGGRIIFNVYILAALMRVKLAELNGYKAS